MKGLIGWARSNIAIVILCVVMLVTLPVTWFFSSRWSGSIRQAQEKAANDDLSAITRAKSFSYTIPAVFPGEEAITVSSAPNEATTELFADMLQRQRTLVEQKARTGLDFNRRNHRPLVEGMFPDPPPARRQLLTIELAKAIVGSGTPSVYDRLLDAINAGGPAEPHLLATEITDLQNREIERLTAERGAKGLTEEDEDTIFESLVSRRLGEYKKRAREISVYATREVFPAIHVPRVMPEVSKVGMPDCFTWQWDYWLYSDVLAAVAFANTDENGRPTTIEDSVVKRIESVEADRPPFYEPQTKSRSLAADSMMGSTSAGGVPLNLNISHTGRVNGADNQDYDVRPVTLTVIVDPARLPKLFDALGRVNFMTVLRCDLEEVEVWEHLALGYYYGNEPVARATLRIETIWLRDWTAPLMPEVVRQALAVELPEKENELELGSG